MAEAMNGIRKLKNIIVVMPAYNAARTLAETVQAAASIPSVSSIVVVDDGSTDDTAAIAKASGALLVSHEANRGKGAALQTGIEAALESGADAIVLLDSDLGSCVTEAARLIAPVQSGEANMTIARFMGSGGGGFGIVKKMSRAILHRFTGQWFESPLSGQRVITSELARKVSLRGGWGVEIGLTIDAHRAGFRVMEVPVEMSQKGTGRNLKGFLHRGRQMSGILRTTVEIMLGLSPRRGQAKKGN
jgi:glycosyltransferase involved in cell wall biosynthesis